jgi:hypothetical protein
MERVKGFFSSIWGWVCEKAQSVKGWVVSKIEAVKTFCHSEFTVETSVPTVEITDGATVVTPATREVRWGKVGAYVVGGTTGAVMGVCSLPVVQIPIAAVSFIALFGLFYGLSAAWVMGCATVTAKAVDGLVS